MDDHDEIQHLRQDGVEDASRLAAEVRRLKSRVFSLEEENESWRLRYSYQCQELERTRAKVPKGISTS